MRNEVSPPVVHVQRISGLATGRFLNYYSYIVRANESAPKVPFERFSQVPGTGRLSFHDA
jgi:hypothetical protein